MTSERYRGKVAPRARGPFYVVAFFLLIVIAAIPAMSAPAWSDGDSGGMPIAAAGQEAGTQEKTGAEAEQEKKAQEKKAEKKTAAEKEKAEAEEDMTPDEKAASDAAAAAAATTSDAAPPQTKITLQEGGIQVIARSQQKTADRIYAVGEVEVHYKTAKLFADRIEVDPVTRNVRAEGNVVLQLPNEVITSQNIFFNLDEAVGSMENVRGMIQPSVYYRAESLEKKPDNLYILNKAQVTSCSQPTPRWDFAFSRANLKKGDYVEMWNAVFRLKNVPIFYLPYMRYPLEQERTTGFLMPSVGFSGPKGFTLSQSFYWAMARNMDATITADLYSARGMGAGLQFRYLFGDGTQGDANLYGFTFRQDELGQKPENAYILRLNHSQRLPLGFVLAADVDMQSSFDFLREFDNNFRRAVISNRRSQAFISRSWSGFNLSARVSRFETYFAQIGTGIVTRNLPQISFSSFKIPLFKPVFLSFNSSFTSWEYGWADQYEAGVQTKSSNLAFSPTLSAPFSLIPWLTLNSQVTTNFVYHFQSNQANTRNIIDEPLLQRNVVMRFDLVGPVINRIYRDGRGEAKVKHIVEPYASYNFDSPVAGANRIITTTGMFFRYHQVSYGLNNRFLVKQGGRTREAVSVGVGQTYYIAYEDSPLSRFKINGEIPRFSEISGFVRYRPVGNMTLDAAAGYNPYTKQVGSLRFGAGLGSQATNNAFMSINWYKSMNSWRENLGGYESYYFRHQIGVTGGLKIPRAGLEILGDIDFNVQEKKLLYTAASFIYHYQCIDIGAEVKVFYFRYMDQPDVQFRINLGLGNIGKTTDFLGGFGF